MLLVVAIETETIEPKRDLSIGLEHSDTDRGREIVRANGSRASVLAAAAAAREHRQSIRRLVLHVLGRQQLVKTRRLAAKHQHCRRRLLHLVMLQLM